MLGFIKSIICGNDCEESGNIPGKQNNKVQIATCALLIEVANSDNEFRPEERLKIIDIMKNTFGLEEKIIEELIELSHQEIKESVSLYEFTEIINSNFSEEEKFEIIKNIWRLVLVDNELDAHEDHIIKKIGGNLHIYNQEIIEAKLLVKEEIKKRK
ncbi:MAG: TerB family tellurite resistance protein [Ignavibacteria bacterium]|nr:TerB family tellurite resistance protein [Ignavibacteria bacterium]